MPCCCIAPFHFSDTCTGELLADRVLCSSVWTIPIHSHLFKNIRLSLLQPRSFWSSHLPPIVADKMPLEKTPAQPIDPHASCIKGWEKLRASMFGLERSKYTFSCMVLGSLWMNNARLYLPRKLSRFWLLKKLIADSVNIFGFWELWQLRLIAYKHAQSATPVRCKYRA